MFLMFTLSAGRVLFTWWKNGKRIEVCLRKSVFSPSGPRYQFLARPKKGKKKNASPGFLVSPPTRQ